MMMRNCCDVEEDLKMLIFHTNLSIQLFYQKNHQFTDLVIVFYHCIVKHNGTRDTLNKLRSEYWIPQGRSYINKILRQSIVRKKHEGKSTLLS